MPSWIRHALALLLPACFHPQYDRPVCGPGGTCPFGFTCSAANVCESGNGPAGPPDAAPMGPELDAGPPLDAASTEPPIDAQQCFGTGLVKVCLTSAPTQPVTLPALINTSSNVTSCTQIFTQAGGPELCVIAGTTIAATVPVVATGARALVLIGATSVTVSATLDVSSTTNGTPRRGAGGNTGACNAPSVPGNQALGAGGGAGGSLSTKGGDGGKGNTNGASQVAPGGTAGNVQPTPTLLRGGCPGGKGGDSQNPGGAAGDGGGAVYLIAGTSITVSGNIFASGAGGGAINNSNGQEQGGGGGGAGGMIGLDAPTVTLTGGRLVANGGGGGGGGGAASGPGTGGTPGGDGTTSSWDQQAAGGAPGNGGTGTVGGGLGTAIGKTNNTSGPDAFGGGGGGGGGLGYIWVKGAVSGATMVSPTPIVAP